MDYPKTAETVVMRGQLRALNAFLEAADITFVDDGLGAVDLGNRTMRRHFVHSGPAASPKLAQGGRLYGGFWQTLPRQRRASLRIDGEPLAVLDFASMHLRLVYACEGVVPPDGDLYARPGLEGQRAAVKLITNVLLNDRHHSRARWPEGEEIGQPSGWAIKALRAALWGRHPVLRDAFGRQLGLELQFTESKIMVEVLDRLRLQRVPGLGLHDGLMVPMSRAGEAEEVMRIAAQEVAGQAPPVAVKVPEGSTGPHLHYHL